MHPPPMPREAIDWFIRHAIGTDTAKTLWAGVWTTGFVQGAELGILAILVVNVAIINVALIVARNRK